MIITMTRMVMLVVMMLSITMKTKMMIVRMTMVYLV